MMSPDAAVGCVRRSSPEPWSGEKRRKGADGCPYPPLGIIPSSSDDATDETMMRIPSQIQEGFVFSAKDDIGSEELSRCAMELQSRRHLIYVDKARSIPRKDWFDLDKRLAGIRLNEYKILRERGDIPDDTAPPDPDWPFEYAFDLGPPSVFGWTVDPEHYYLTELNDYQRIVPTIASMYEYYNWDEYRTTFSKYDTDVDYVKYCDELSKKIKWIEVYLAWNYCHQFHQTYKGRGYNQALKIAAGFSHLPLSLAARGYEEYIRDLRHELELKDYIRAAFEVWKRVIEHEMSFEDALMQTLSENTFHYSSNIEDEIIGHRRIYLIFRSCMEQIPDVKDNDEALKFIMDRVYRGDERRKMYVEYVKKKLEIAQRIGLTGVLVP